MKGRIDFEHHLRVLVRYGGDDDDDKGEPDQPSELDLRPLERGHAQTVLVHWPHLARYGEAFALTLFDHVFQNGLSAGAFDTDDKLVSWVVVGK